jgi:hypothetical protein
VRLPSASLLLSRLFELLDDRTFENHPGLCCCGYHLWILHDQVTARVCVEYLTVFHPPVFATQSPTLLAFRWGVIATWWVGLFLGLFLALAARAGPYPKLSGRELFHPIARLLLVMACCALAAGMTGGLSCKLSR